MKKISWIVSIFLGIIAVSSCAKQNTGCQSVAPATEKKIMDSFCVANNINYIEHSSGLMYQIINPGSGFPISQNSIIYVAYTGKLLDNTVFETFDARTEPDPSKKAFYMNGIIDGWKIGVPLIKKGGRILLVIPSAYAYGCIGGGTKIPPNSPLYFDITLVDVQ